jgi:acetoin utilization deacetylase AcuC-like enzyme
LPPAGRLGTRPEAGSNDAVARTGLVHHPACLEHFAGPGHPERPERVAAILERLRAGGLTDELDVREAGPADAAALARVHAPAHVRAIEAACRGGRALLDDGDTYVSSESWSAALCAAGGTIDAVERVRSGAWSNAFVAVRPPGHHAEETHAMGFCLFNNVAVAAAHLRTAGVERVAIVDWDVHHGNGTQHLFERDPTVFYASLHQYPHYPGTGAADERGLGAGAGTTLNCPLRPEPATANGWRRSRTACCARSRTSRRSSCSSRRGSMRTATIRCRARASAKAASVR